MSYWYVLFPCLTWYFSPHLILHTRSFDCSDLTNLRLSILYITKTFTLLTIFYFDKTFQNVRSLLLLWWVFVVSNIGIIISCARNFKENDNKNTNKGKGGWQYKVTRQEKHQRNKDYFQYCFGGKLIKVNLFHNRWHYSTSNQYKWFIARKKRLFTTM